MRFIKLEAITAAAAAVIEEYGDVWEVKGRVDNPDSYHFLSRKPHLYIVPIPKTVRNPKENLGDNYTPSGTIANAGARWILEDNDPSFDVSEYKFGRAA